jgi:hypothetical protein
MRLPAWVKDHLFSAFEFTLPAGLSTPEGTEAANMAGFSYLPALRSRAA